MFFENAINGKNIIIAFLIRSLFEIKVVPAPLVAAEIEYDSVQNMKSGKAYGQSFRDY